MPFEPPDYYNVRDYPLVKKKERKKRKKKPRLRIGDRIELIFINLPDDDTNLKPGDKGTVNDIKSTTNDYAIHVDWDDNSEETTLFVSEDKWKIIKHAK